MKYSPTCFRLMLFSLAPLFSQTGFAQDDLEKRQKALKENTEQLNRVYENNLPNKKGSVYSALTPAEIEASWNGGKMKTQNGNVNREKEIYNQLVFDEEKGAYYIPGSPKHVSFSLASEKMLNELMYTVAEKKQLYLSDKIAWFKDTYFITAMEEHHKLLPLGYNAAADAILKFSEINGTADHQALYDLVWQARILPLSARNMILYLYQKFPDKQKETELLELKLLPYFFGAGRPYLSHRWADLQDYKNSPYPGCFYEYTNTPASMRTEILERFIELAKKYPEEGLMAAGFCRSHLNPFTLYAESNKNLTDAEKEDLYWKAIHIKRALPDVDYESSIGKTVYPFGGNDYVFLLFKKPLTWLIEKREDRIRSLTPTDWLEISARTATSLNQMDYVKISAERKYKYEDVVLFRKYKNFKTAYQLEEKKWKNK